jgi:hypothetical protein
MLKDELKSEQGSGTVFSLGLICCVIIVLTAILGVASLQSRQHHLQDVANFAALAGADENLLDLNGCGASLRVADLNDAQIDECVLLPDGDIKLSASDPRVPFIRVIAIAGPSAFKCEHGLL